MNIIVVDEDSETLELLLEYGGLDKEDVRAFHSPIAAIKYAAEHEIDLAFIDCDTKVIESLNVIRYLRRIRPNCAVYVLVNDGVDIDYVSVAQHVGAADFIHKPLRETSFGFLTGAGE
ncbi:MAG TPA: response regulator [Spirochaetota bacterium]|nr:response regulator [Spirochaetota bacterium]HNT13000.1 response regulator [Spirochaetota bacterium]